jgi:3-deoxy-D-manno-octulosonic-acid transferase
VVSPIDFAYYALLLLAWPVFLWKALRKRGRRHLAGLRQRLGACAPRQGDRPCIWIHGVSVGEILATEPLLGALRRDLPEYEVVLSTTTGTGQQVARRSHPELQVIYFPLDFSWAVHRVFQAIRPDLVVLVELEVWPNFVAEAERRRVPVAIVNGRITERSFRGYRRVRQLFFAPLRRLGRVCAQTEAYARRFQALGVPARRIHITGSMKYDQLTVGEAPERAATRRDFGLGPDETVIIGGSTHPGEERALLACYVALREDHPDLRLVLCPRHNERTGAVQQEVRDLAGEVTLRTDQDTADSPPPVLEPGQVLLVDTMGELGRLYAAADVVFVGGSLIPHGGQNMLEPVMLGRPTLFGPFCDNFKEPVGRLLRAQGARQVQREDELEPALRELLDRPEQAQAMGLRGREALLAARGATDRTLAVIRSQLRQSPRSRRVVRRLIGTR